MAFAKAVVKTVDTIARAVWPKASNRERERQVLAALLEAHPMPLRLDDIVARLARDDIQMSMVATMTLMSALKTANLVRVVEDPKGIRYALSKGAVDRFSLKKPNPSGTTTDAGPSVRAEPARLAERGNGGPARPATSLNRTSVSTAPVAAHLTGAPVTSAGADLIDPMPSPAVQAASTDASATEVDAVLEALSDFEREFRNTSNDLDAQAQPAERSDFPEGSAPPAVATQPAPGAIVTRDTAPRLRQLDPLTPEEMTEVRLALRTLALNGPARPGSARALIEGLVFEIQGALAAGYEWPEVIKACGFASSDLKTVQTLYNNANR